MTLEELLALLPDNNTGAIDAADLRTIVTELWNNNADADSVNEAQDTELTALDGRVDGVETENATQNTAITTLDGRVDAVEAVNATQDTAIAAVEGINTTQDTALTSLDTRVDALEAGGGGDYVETVGARSDSDTEPIWTTEFTGALEETDQNVAEHWSNGELRAGQNEWGAFRAWSAPYPDAAFRAIRDNNSDEGSGGTSQCFHINDRRTSATYLHTWARLWNGTLIRNSVAMADVYVTTYADPTTDPVYAALPNGTLIVSTA